MDIFETKTHAKEATKGVFPGPRLELKDKENTRPDQLRLGNSVSTFQINHAEIKTKPDKSARVIHKRKLALLEDSARLKEKNIYSNPTES